MVVGDIGMLTFKKSKNFFEESKHIVIMYYLMLLNLIMFGMVCTFDSTKLLNLITNKSNIRRTFIISMYRKHCSSIFLGAQI